MPYDYDEGSTKATIAVIIVVIWRCKVAFAVIKNNLLQACALDDISIFEELDFIPFAPLSKISLLRLLSLCCSLQFPIVRGYILS